MENLNKNANKASQEVTANTDEKHNRNWSSILKVGSIAAVLSILAFFGINIYIDHKIEKGLIEKVVKRLMISEGFFSKITESIEKEVLPKIIKSELEPYIDQLRRLPQGQFTHSGVVTVNETYTIYPPWGTTDDWDIIVVPIAPGYENKYQKKGVNEPYRQLNIDDIKGSLNDYECYVIRADGEGSKGWKIIGSQILEIMWSSQGKKPIDVFFLMIAKLKPPNE